MEMHAHFENNKFINFDAQLFAIRLSGTLPHRHHFLSHSKIFNCFVWPSHESWVFIFRVGYREVSSNRTEDTDADSISFNWMNRTSAGAAGANQIRNCQRQRSDSCVCWWPWLKCLLTFSTFALKSHGGGRWCGKRHCPDLCSQSICHSRIRHIILFEDEDKKSNDLNWVIHYSTDSSCQRPAAHTVIRLPSHKPEEFSFSRRFTFQFLSRLIHSMPRWNKRSLNSVHVAFRFTYRPIDRPCCVSFAHKSSYFVDESNVGYHCLTTNGRMCPFWD